MAENSRMSKLSEKDDECIFSWKLFTGWDYMIGNPETAHNRIASVILGFKEALLEEAEKKKDLKNWRIISLRVLVNICVILLLAGSAGAVVTVVSRTYDKSQAHGWWQENETTVVITAISTAFPVFFELLGFFEHYHPRKQLRIQLARIMLLNLLNLYSLIITLFSRIEDMSEELNALKPSIDAFTNENSSVLNSTLELNYALPLNGTASNCSEVSVPCLPCDLFVQLPLSSVLTTLGISTLSASTSEPIKKILTFNASTSTTTSLQNTTVSIKHFKPENLIEISTEFAITDETTTYESFDVSLHQELLKLRDIAGSLNNDKEEDKDADSDSDDGDYIIEDISNGSSLTVDIETSTYETSPSAYISEVIYDDNLGTNSNSNSISTESTNYDIDESSTEVTDEDNLSSEFVPIFNISTEVTLNNHDSTTDFTSTGQTYSTDITYIEPTSELVNSSTIEYETTEQFVGNPIPNIENYNESSINSSKNHENKSTIVSNKIYSLCPNITLRCQFTCAKSNITQVFILSNCTIVNKYCLATKCSVDKEAYSNILNNSTKALVKNATDTVYIDKNNRKIYNLTVETKKKLLKLCWETTFGQELVKLTMMDLVMVLFSALFSDFFRALFVRYMNRCWCWDLEKKFPEYGDFKIAENILHLINNQGIVWMGMFFSPGLVVLNIFKLVIMMYLRSWVVMTCNVPHEVVFRVSKSNNFYLALLLTMLFLYVLPVGYSIVWIKPSWHCGPFSEYDKIYQILTDNIYKILPPSLNFALKYMASAAIVIPLLVLLILIIYYLTSLTNSLREANNDLKIQLRRERTEERRKMFQMVDNRRRAGSSSIDNTPFSRWKKALPSLPLGKSIDSDNKKPTNEEEGGEPKRIVKKKGGIFAKIVSMALDLKPEVESIPENIVSQSPNGDDETDTDFHETLPKEVLKIKDITIDKITKKPALVDIKPLKEGKHRESIMKVINKFKVTPIKEVNISDTTPTIIEKTENTKDQITEEQSSKHKSKVADVESCHEKKKLSRQQTSESSTQSRQSDSIGSVIPVITISTTESDDELLQAKKQCKEIHVKEVKGSEERTPKKEKKATSELKSLRRQSSVDSIKEQKIPKKIKEEGGHKYQYSL